MSDFLVELRLAGFSSRLKRLSDNLLYNSKEFYRSQGIDIEPNWHLVFLLLKKHEALSLTDISSQLQLSHPAIIKIIKNMKAAGYVQSQTDTLDSRKRIITLTPKACLALPQLETYWASFEQSVQELLSDSPGLLSDLSELEDKLRIQSFKDRTLKNLKADKFNK